MKPPGVFRSNWLVAGIAVVLLLALGLQALPRRYEYHYRLPARLALWLPDPLPGWTAKDEPIAETRNVAEAVGELLNYTDGVYRIYRSANAEIKVYVAYWEPGRMDPRLVSIHSPDVCWVGAGWKQEGRRSRMDLVGANSALFGGHHRIFRIGSVREEVVFWHLVGGRPSRYLEAGENIWTWGEIFRNPLAASREQFLIRISTSGDMNGVAGDPMMQRIVDVLAQAQHFPR